MKEQVRESVAGFETEGIDNSGSTGGSVVEKSAVSKKLECGEKSCHNKMVVEMPGYAFAESGTLVESALKAATATKWLWWGGDCEACLSQGGLHDSKPAAQPPLHPNCDCILMQIEATPEQAQRLRELLDRGVRLVREINLLLKDKHLSERQREVLEAARRELDWLMRDVVEERRMFDYFLVELKDALREVELKVSRVKFELSLREANEQAGEEGALDEDEWYSDKALDKADEFDDLLKAAAEEFGVSFRAVRAAFTDEFDDRKWYIDPEQDLLFRLPKDANIPFTDKSIPYYKGILEGIKNWAPRNDIGLSNINIHTAERLEKKYNIEIPEGLNREQYIVTDEGCAKFTAAAIKEAEEIFEEYKAQLPIEKKEILDRINKEEKDALAVAIYKRGHEAILENLDNQLEIITQKPNKQKYVHVFEGYNAWEYWIRKEENETR